MTVYIRDHDIGVGLAGGGVIVNTDDVTDALKVDVSQLPNLTSLNAGASAEIERFTVSLYGPRTTKLTVEILGSRCR